MIPKLSIQPLKAGLSEKGGQLAVMLTITPPELTRKLQRPDLNLALVIDKSGSMNGKPLAFAKQAAKELVSQLQPNDLVSVINYDTEVTVLHPSSLANNKRNILAMIDKIQAGSSTNLQAGWLEGATQVSQQHMDDRINRVILLSDGLANQGETNAAILSQDCLGLAQHGVSTTTLGLGRQFNEDLLQGMAEAGEGNYYFIESPEQLPEIFNAELLGLSATLGTQVKLKLTAHADVQISKILNDLPFEDDHLKLPNLVAGMPIELAAYLNVPASARGKTSLGTVTLTYQSSETQERLKVEENFSLEVMSNEDYQALEENLEVQAFFETLTVSRLKKEASQALEQGKHKEVTQLLHTASARLKAAPQTERIAVAQQELNSLEEAVQRDSLLAAKRMKAQAYRSSRSYYPEKLVKPPKKVEAKQSYKLKATNGPVSKLEIIQGDITSLAVDAIVNPTNVGLFGTGQSVDGAIHRKAGPELTEACRKIGGCKLGTAVFTPGFNLAATYVIHTATPSYQDDAKDLRILASCYQTSLELASRLNLNTLAFPAMGTGQNKFPVQLAAKIAITTVLTYLKRNPSIAKIYLVCYDQAMFEQYATSLKQLSSKTDVLN